MENILENIDKLRSENSALLLHINHELNNHDGHSVASLTQLRAAKADAEKSFNHICKAGEVLRFGKYL